VEDAPADVGRAAKKRAAELIAKPMVRGAMHGLALTGAARQAKQLKPSLSRQVSLTSTTSTAAVGTGVSNAKIARPLSSAESPVLVLPSIDERLKELTQAWLVSQGACRGD
jgi:hypothetical protein